MFTLEDGREQLYQWDIDRRIIVNDPNICEVHFCNRTSDCSLVVEVKDGFANIPNILLHDARPIRAYAYCDDKYTLTETHFSVKARTKPEDYVYTETEVKSYEDLEARIEALEENPSGVDLSDYYTKAETDEAIYNSKDTYYLDFSKATNEAQPATAEMIEFVTRFKDGQNVCAHIKGIESSPNQVHGWQPVTVQKALNNYHFTPNAINPYCVAEGLNTRYYTFTVKEDSTAGWSYYIKDYESFAIATTDYVDNAIANIDIPEGTSTADTYFLDTTTLEWSSFGSRITAILPEEFNEFGQRIKDGKQVHIYIKTGEYWQLARWCYKGSRIYLTRTPTWEDMGTEVTVDNFDLTYSNAGTSECWVIGYHTNQSSKYHIATKQYVDEVLGVIENGSY